MDSYVLRRSYSKRTLYGKKVFTDEVTFWSKTPSHAFSYDGKRGTFWNRSLNEYVIRHSYLWLLLKWKLLSKKLIESSYTYEIVKENEALVAGVINE